MRHANDAPPLLGAVLVVFAAACFAALDTTVRFAGAGLPVLLMLWARYVFQALAMGLWLALDPGKSFRTRQPRFQALRGTCCWPPRRWRFTACSRCRCPNSSRSTC